MKPLYFLRLGLLLSAAIYLLLLNRLPAQQLRLKPPVVLSNHVIELSLTGTVAGSYVFEMSTNLSNWLPLSTGIATNGLLTIQHPDASNFSRLFYRAHSTNVSLPPIIVGVQPDTNVTVTTLMSPQGGHGILYGRDGTRFTLTLASNSAPDSQLVTVRLVTNLTSLPFARGTFGTVLIEPTNLVLWGAATLEIDFPTTIDKREVISFRANRDGSGFQLTPDRVRTNRVVIPITQPGIYGSALATAAELANASLIEIGDRSFLAQIASASGSKLKFKAVGAPDCFPAKQQVADAVASQIDKALAEKSRQIAALAGAERQRQQQGYAEDSPSALSSVADDLCTFYMAEILPRWADAVTTCNCPLGAVLMQFSLTVERERQLMGATNDCISLGTLPICALLHCCVADIRACCDMGVKGPDKVNAILRILREDQLLVLDCLTDAEAQDALNACSSNAWTGSFSVVESAAETVTTSGNGFFNSDVSEYNAMFGGATIESVETGSPQTGLQVQIKFAGAQSGRDFSSQTAIRSSTCQAGSQRSTSGSTQFDSRERVAAVDTTYQLNLITQPGGTYIMFGSQVHSTNSLSAPATYTEVTFKRTTGCDGSESTISHSTSSPSSFMAMSLPFTFGTMTSSNTISGGSTVVDTGLTPPRTYVFKWSFKRNTSFP